MKTEWRFQELGVSRQWALENGWDWSAVNATGPVRDQARTGTCWAFSTTLVAETASWVAGNPLTELAPQVLMDCLHLECEGELCQEDKK